MNSKILAVFLVFFGLIFCVLGNSCSDPKFEGINYDVNSTQFELSCNNEPDSVEHVTLYQYKEKNSDKVEFSFLKNYPNLKKFEVFSAEFDTVPKFDFNEKLEILWLSDNIIKNIARGAFANLKSLKELWMRFNAIESVSKSLFKENKKLKLVDFQFNKIKKFDRKLLWGLTELETVDFSFNEIDFVDADIFKDNKKLKTISFRNNKFFKISPQIFDGLKNLETTLFQDNPCNAGLQLGDFSKCYKDWSNAVEFVKKDTTICGKPLQLLTLVFGGTPISRGKYPWIAAFYDKDKFQCGSSLISSRHILLAAHCIHDKLATPKDPIDCKFKLGKFNLLADEPGSLDVEVSEFILHPYWDANSFEYRGDIAVAVLMTIVQFTQFIRPICLNEQKFFNFHNEAGTVIGWGATEQNPIMENDVALEVNIKIHETRECLHLDQDLKHFISPESFCAGNRNNTGSCSGDSGGSLIVHGVSGFKAVGVVSASLRNFDGYCDNTKNQIYTEVAAFHDWIINRVFVTY